MKSQKELSVKFGPTMYELFKEMDDIRKEFNLIRLNSIILLKALLQVNNSILYDFLCSTSEINPYRSIIKECNKELGDMKENEIKGEKTFSIQYKKEINYYYVSPDFADILNNLFQELAQLAIENETDEIEAEAEDIFIIFMKYTPRQALNILKNNGVYIEGVKEYYEFVQEMYDEQAVETVQLDEKDENKIPKAISDFVTVLSAKYKGVRTCEILGRDKECQKVIRTLQKRGRKNAILVGEPGVGKTAIAEKIAFDIAHGNCPDSLKDNMVLQLNVNNSVAGTQYRGMAEERFKLLVEFLEKHENVILFIDEIHMVIGAGSTAKNDSDDMANALKPFLAGQKSKVIGATTQKEYDRYFSNDEAFKRRFEKVLVKEPKAKDVYPMLKNAIKVHEKFHNVKIRQNMVEYAVLISSCFNKNTKNPDRTKDLIDTAMVIAKEKGKKSVDKESILENFDINFDQYRNMDEKEKLATAYHEAGHYLMWRKSGRLKDIKGIAISIMPAQDYMGVTTFDDIDDEETVYKDKDYYIDYIALFVAGRVAEKKYTNNISAGASTDLKIANNMAYKLVCEYGMSEQNKNHIYVKDDEEQRYPIMSEKICNSIDDEVNMILSDATKRAEEVISENEDLLQKLARELLKNGILDENAIEKICKPYEMQ